MILSLYDFTSYALMPWARAGHRCVAVDLLHASNQRVDRYENGGSIQYIAVDLTSRDAVRALLEVFAPRLVFAFPVCTHLAGSGASRWAKKAEEDRYFHVKAIMPVTDIHELCTEMGIPYILENPVGLLSTAWREPSWTFSPHEYGGYLPVDDRHPLFPEVIPPRDAYTKRTLIWTNSPKLDRPPVRPVDPQFVSTVQGDVSPQYAKLGGKSLSTKAARSATPRGFSEACYHAYKDAV
jgi:hypothetical protein